MLFYMASMIDSFAFSSCLFLFLILEYRIMLNKLKTKMTENLSTCFYKAGIFVLFYTDNQLLLY